MFVCVSIQPANIGDPHSFRVCTSMLTSKSLTSALMFLECYSENRFIDGFLYRADAITNRLFDIFMYMKSVRKLNML